VSTRSPAERSCVTASGPMGRPASSWRGATCHLPPDPGVFGRYRPDDYWSAIRPAFIGVKPHASK
jgi:hypothetical protein